MNSNSSIKTPFTIAFLIHKDNVLMIHRKRSPWMGKWNGLGGKKEGNESAYECMVREVKEETNIALEEDAQIIDKGLITWDTKDGDIQGMNAFVINLPGDKLIWEGTRMTDEGEIAWKPLDWVCMPNNSEVATNISYYLSEMLNSDRRKQYHCIFTKDSALVKSSLLK